MGVAPIDAAETERLGRVLLRTLSDIKFLWNPPEQALRAKLPVADMRALGWLEPQRFTEVARDVVVRDILNPLATIGIGISDTERAELF